MNKHGTHTVKAAGPYLEAWQDLGRNRETVTSFFGDELPLGTVIRFWRVKDGKKIVRAGVVDRAIRAMNGYQHGFYWVKPILIGRG